VFHPSCGTTFRKGGCFFLGVDKLNQSEQNLPLVEKNGLLMSINSLNANVSCVWRDDALKDFEELRVQSCVENDVDAVDSILWEIASKCCESSEYANAIQNIKDVEWLRKYVFSRLSNMHHLFVNSMQYKCL
jgi:hypothetical protein